MCVGTYNTQIHMCMQQQLSLSLQKDVMNLKQSKERYIWEGMKEESKNEEIDNLKHKRNN